MATTSTPTVGIIYRRDSAPSAKRLADLQDPEIAAAVLCDEHVPLDVALERTWQQDAHMIMYRVDADECGPPDGEYAYARVSKRSPFVMQLEREGGRIRVPLLLFDYDLPKTPEGVKQSWSADGLSSFVEGLQQAVGTSIPEPTAFYTTLHGSRFVYVLSEEVGQLDAEAMARGLVQQFAEAGIELDHQCSDWTRLFRLPRTTREDSGEPYDPDVLLTGGPVLDVNSCPRVEGPGAADGERFADVGTYVGEMPDPDEVRDLLTKVGANNRRYDSDLVKSARTYLQGRDAHAVVFEHKPLVQGEEGWNNQVVRIIGQTVGMLARQDCATPEGIYALLHSSVEQLQDRENRGAQETDWFTTAWDLVCRMWANEQAQVEAERQELERAAAAGKEHRDGLIEQLREARPGDVPEDPDDAREWFRSRMIASDGRRHYIMRRDGSYNIRPVSDSMLIPMIRDLDMEESIPTTELRGKQLVQRGPASLLNEYATPITNIECSATERVAYIDGDAGHKILHIPVHRLNPKLAPGGIYSDAVDEWLKAMGGEHSYQLMEWLAHSLDVLRPICALNLYGAPGTGKNMLVAGLAECFEGERQNDGRALGKFNLGLLDSPVVNCDEGVPSISNDESPTVDQAFRSLVTGGRVTIRAMHTNPFNANIYPRILFTSNDRDIIRSIVGHRDLTPDDIKAIELRLLSIRVDNAAQRLLTRRGNYRHTAGWVSGEYPSRYVIANHIYYLFNHRRPSASGTGRLLVEGESETPLIREMRMRSRGAQTVLRALIKMMESSQAKKGMHMHHGRVWVTPSGLVEFTESALSSALEPVSLIQAGRVLRQFSVEDMDDRAPMIVPPGLTRDDRARWVEVDLAVVFEEGARHGIPMNRVRTLLLQQEGGEFVIERVYESLTGEGA